MQRTTITNAEPAGERLHELRPASNVKPMNSDLVSQCFHALSEPTRIRILELLKTNESCVQDMIAALNISQSHLSFHLKTLKEAGLVTANKRGRFVYYRLNVDQFGVLETYLSGY
ncbi:MAG: ArsR/SmtB family transcription factor [Phormidesmis sp.]